MEIKIVTRPEFTIVGLKYRGKNENNEIPQTWQALMPRMHEIQGLVDPEVCYGVCDNMDESEGAFDYVAAFEIASDTPTTPEGLVRWEIPAQTYATLECTLPTIGEAYHYVYDDWLPNSEYSRTAGPELELYDKDFSPDIPTSKMYLYIPIK